MSSEIINLMNEEKTKDFIRNNKRFDNRKFDEFRKLDIKKGIIPLADGSAWVKLGDTEVIVGVKFIVTTPFPDSPDEGGMTLNLELTGVSSPDFFTGPPQIDALEYGRVADRAIRHSGIIDMKSLCIKKGEKSFMMFIDCYAVNAAGNLIDATEIAAIAALQNTKIPKLNENNEIVAKEYSGNLEIKGTPLSITFEKIDDKLIVDPTDQEEYVSDSRFSIGVIGDKIISCHKGKGGVLKQEDIDKMMDISIKKAKELEKQICDFK